MAESWEDLPIVTPKPAGNSTAASWEDLPVLGAEPEAKPEALSDPYAGQKADYDAFKADTNNDPIAPTVIDGLIGDVSGYKPPVKFDPGSIGPAPKGDGLKAPSILQMEATHLEATKNTPIIPGLQSTSPQGVRAALAGVTMNAAPRLLAAMDSRPFEVGLHDWHKLYAEAREDHPGMELLGGLISPMPFAKAKLAGKVAVGSAAGFLSGWLGADPEDASAKFDAAKTGAVLGGTILGGTHVAAPVVGKAVKKMLPPRRVPQITIATPEFSANLTESLNAVPSATPVATKAIPESAYFREGDSPDLFKPFKGPAPAPLAGPKAVLQQLATDPSKVPTRVIADIEDVKPFDASITMTPEGGLLARVRELGPDGTVGVHEADVTTSKQLFEFKKTMLRFHEGTAIVPDTAALRHLAGDDVMWATLYPKKQVAANMAREESVAGSSEASTKNSKGGATRKAPEQYISPADEAPSGPIAKPSMIVEDPGGYLAMHQLDSPKAKVASLEGRSVVAIETPEGVRYAHSPAHTEGETMLVVPFDAAEGIPTIAQVSRVNPKKFRIPEREELEALVSKPQKGTSTPEVNEGLKDQDWSDVTPRNVDIPVPPMPPKLPPQGPEPMPPSDPPTPPPPPMATQEAIVAKLAGNMNPLIRQLVHASQRADIDLANHISDLASIKNIEKVKFALNTALERKLGSHAKVKEFRRDVMLAFEGHLPQSKLEEMYPEEVFVPKRKILEQAVALRDSNDAWFRENGYLEAKSEDFTPEQLQAYVNREYAAHTLPDGEYAKIVAKDDAKMRLAVAGFKNWKLQKGVEISDDEARSLILQSLGSKDAALELFGQSSLGKSGNAAASMKKRLDLPDWYKAVLGENRDGFHAVSRTIAKQEALRNQYQIFEQVVANPKWMKDRSQLQGPEVDSWKQIPDDPKTFGKAAGKMADPFVYDALITLPNAKNAADGIMSTIYGFMKTNQMGFPSMRTLANMFASNVEAGMLAGGVDPTRPVATYKGLKYVNRAMSEFKKNPLADNEYAQFMRDMRRIGADAPGHIGLDLNAMQAKQMQNVTSHMENYKGEQNYQSYMGAAMKAHQWAAKPGSMTIDWFDRIQKLGSMKIITDDLVHGGMGAEEAMRAAYKRVAYSNPMFDRLPPLAERMRGGMLGAANLYSGYAMERNRIWSQIPGRLMRSLQDIEDPGFKWRLAKFGAVGTAMFAGGFSSARRFIGQVSDEDIESAMQNRKGTVQEKFNPVPWVLPVRIDGKLVVMDMTQWSAPLALMQGDPSMSPLARAALNMVKQPLEGGVLGDMVNVGLEQVGINAGMSAMRPPLPGTNPAVNIAEFAAKRGALPRLPQDLYEQVKSSGAVGGLGMRREVQPGLSALGKGLGAPIESTQTVGIGGQSPAFFNKVKLEAGQIANATAILRMAAQMPADKAQGPLQSLIDALSKDPTPAKKKVMDAAIKLIQQHAKDLGEAGRAKRAADASHHNENPPDAWEQLPVLGEE